MSSTASSSAPSPERGGTAPREGWVARHQLSLFFALAFLLSWSVWPLVLLEPDSSPMVPFGPTIAALVVTALVGGWRAIGDLLQQLARWRVHPLWYAIAVLGPFALTSLAAAAVVAGGAPSPDWSAYTDWSGLLVTLLSTAAIVGLFEEPGWRGYALPMLQRDRSALAAAVLLGVVWAVWHLPELISDAGEREPLPYLIAVVAWSVVLAWVYNSTGGSLLLVILMHAAINTAMKFLMPTFGVDHYDNAFWAMAAVWTIAAAAVVAVAGPRRLRTDLRLRRTAGTRASRRRRTATD